MLENLGVACVELEDKEDLRWILNNKNLWFIYILVKFTSTLYILKNFIITKNLHLYQNYLCVWVMINIFLKMKTPHYTDWTNLKTYLTTKKLSAILIIYFMKIISIQDLKIFIRCLLVMKYNQIFCLNSFRIFSKIKNTKNNNRL